jgi:hypothetical protein
MAQRMAENERDAELAELESEPESCATSVEREFPRPRATQKPTTLWSAPDRSRSGPLGDTPLIPTARVKMGNWS